MQVTILDFIKDERGGIVQGKVDVKITYDATRWEIIRNLTYCKKEDNKQWVNMPSCKRDDKWFPIVERPPELLKLMSNNILEALKSYLVNLEPSTFEETSEPVDNSNLF